MRRINNVSKLLGAALCCSLLLGGCGGEASPLPEYAGDRKPSSAVEESEPVHTPPDDTEWRRSRAELTEFIRRGLPSEPMAEAMGSLGVSITVENLNLKDDESFAFTLRLENEAGAVWERELPGTVRYLDESVGYPEEGLFVLWGCLSIVRDNTLALTTPDSIRFLSAETFEELPVPIDLDALRGHSPTLYSTYYSELFGYVVPMQDAGRDALAVFGEDGALLSVDLMPEERFWAYHYQNSFWSYHNMLYDSLGFLELDRPYINGMDHIYSASLGGHSHFAWTLYHPGDERYVFANAIYDRAEEDGRRFVLAEYSHLDDERERVLGYFGLYFDGDGELAGKVFFQGPQLLSVITGPDFDVEVAETAPRITLTGNHPTSVTVMDFAAGTGSMELRFTDEDVGRDWYGGWAVSPGGRWSVSGASWGGAGDGYWAYVVLEDLVGGSIRYLDRLSYDTQRTGFRFVGDDVLCYAPSCTRVLFLRTADLEVLREVELQMPEHEGLLVNVAYDAAADRFALLATTGVELDEIGWQTCEGYTYEVLLFDGEGNHLGGVVTDLEVYSQKFQASAYLFIEAEGDALLIVNDAGLAYHSIDLVSGVVTDFDETPIMQ